MASRADFFLNFMQSLTIRTKAATIAPFRLNHAQRLVWDGYFAPKINQREPMRFVFLKARQLGISTLIQGLLTARFIWDAHVNAKTIAHETDSTENIWNMAKRMVEHSHFAPYARQAGKVMELGGSTYTCSTAGSPHATRSMNLTCLHLSEVAFWKHPDAWLAAMQTVPSQGESWIFVESTANGKVEDGELFYKEWRRASAQESRFTPVFLPWYALPDYCLGNYCYPEDVGGGATDLLVLRDLDPEEQALRKAFDLSAGQLAWRRLIIEDNCRGDVELFHQEYPSTPEEAFIQSGRPLFSSRDILPYHKHITEGERYTLGPDGGLIPDGNGYVEIWKHPEPGHSYIIGADTSMGFDDDGHSRSAGEILDIDTMEQVGEYDCTSPTYAMARHLAILGRYYHEALLAPEITASGGGGGRELLVYLLKDHHYYHIYRYKHVDHIKPDPGRMWGWETNAKTRPRMISRLVETIKERACVIHSEALLNQLTSFGESDTGRVEALSGHDDLLFAFGIAVVVRSEELGRYVSHDLEKGKVTLEHVQAAGVHAMRDAEADWAASWEERFQQPKGRETSWLAL